MPIYEYECLGCHKLFEYLARNSADKSAVCPKCGGKKLERALAAFSVGTKQVASAPGHACASCSSGSCPYGKR